MKTLTESFFKNMGVGIEAEKLRIREYMSSKGINELEYEILDDLSIFLHSERLTIHECPPDYISYTGIKSMNIYCDITKWTNIPQAVDIYIDRNYPHRHLKWITWPIDKLHLVDNRITDASDVECDTLVIKGKCGVKKWPKVNSMLKLVNLDERFIDIKTNYIPIVSVQITRGRCVIKRLPDCEYLSVRNLYTDDMSFVPKSCTTLDLTSSTILSFDNLPKGVRDIYTNQVYLPDEVPKGVKVKKQ